MSQPVFGKSFEEIAKGIQNPKETPKPTEAPKETVATQNAVTTTPFATSNKSFEEIMAEAAANQGETAPVAEAPVEVKPEPVKAPVRSMAGMSFDEMVAAADSGATPAQTVKVDEPVEEVVEETVEEVVTEEVVEETVEEVVTEEVVEETVEEVVVEEVVEETVEEVVAEDAPVLDIVEEDEAEMVDITEDFAIDLSGSNVEGVEPISETAEAVVEEAVVEEAVVEEAVVEEAVVEEAVVEEVKPKTKSKAKSKAKKPAPVITIESILTPEDILEFRTAIREFVSEEVKSAMGEAFKAIAKDLD